MKHEGRMQQWEEHEIESLRSSVYILIPPLLKKAHLDKKSLNLNHSEMGSVQSYGHGKKEFDRIKP